jgi:hypothetical protein
MTRNILLSDDGHNLKQAQFADLKLLIPLMSENEAVYRKLLQIQRKYSRYFIKNKTTVFDCVQIVWSPLTLFILDNDLPAEIQAEIEDIVDAV